MHAMQVLKSRLREGTRLVKRTLYARSISIPSYYISVTTQNLGAHRVRWERERTYDLPKPGIKRWRPPAPESIDSGVIVHVDTRGTITAAVPCALAYGLLPTKSGLMSAQFNEIRLYSSNLHTSQPFSTFKSFNDLHTLRKTACGFLITSSGIDTIFEISEDGQRILWSWCAREHGFTRDSYGVERKAEKNRDHRPWEYSTRQRTTHVNSALPLDENTILATLFHQGIVCGIDRRTGTAKSMISGLSRPHALRWSGDRITFADTARGLAYRGFFAQGSFRTELLIKIESNWLQDCLYTHDLWMLVDAQHSRVYFADKTGTILGYDQFDSDWDFFEVALS